MASGTPYLQIRIIQGLAAPAKFSNHNIGSLITDDFIKSPYQTFFMNQSMVITSVLSKVELANPALEDVINHRFRKEQYRMPATGIEQYLKLKGFETIVHHTVALPIKGTVHICFSKNCNENSRKPELPVSASFLTTYIKGHEKRYRPGISISLT
jgi:hypothetical protein